MVDHLFVGPEPAVRCRGGNAGHLYNYEACLLTMIAAEAKTWLTGPAYQKVYLGCAAADSIRRGSP
jgi:hypothetical protein